MKKLIPIVCVLALLLVAACAPATKSAAEQAIPADTIKDITDNTEIIEIDNLDTELDASDLDDLDAELDDLTW